MKKSKITLTLAQPMGFCAGVERATTIVENALQIYPTPIYVHHEIVHNRIIVNDFQKRGVIFVESIADIPENSVVVFSAHGVSKQVELEAKAKQLFVIDATCPLVRKVHHESIKNEQQGKQVIIIGHRKHAEVIGTAGRIQQQALIVENIQDLDNLDVKDPNKLAYVIQTTLGVEDTKEIVTKLHAKFPKITGLGLKDICYATTNRQNAVIELAKTNDLILVIGSSNSSNSMRLKDIAQKHHCTSYLIDDSQNINLAWFEGKQNIALTAGASAPQKIIEQVIDFLQNVFDIDLKIMNGVIEDTEFKLPLEVTI